MKSDDASAELCDGVIRCLNLIGRVFFVSRELPQELIFYIFKPDFSRDRYRLPLLAVNLLNIRRSICIFGKKHRKDVRELPLLERVQLFKHQIVHVLIFLLL